MIGSVFVPFGTDIAAVLGSVSVVGSGIHSLKFVGGGWLGSAYGEGLVMSSMAGTQAYRHRENQS